MFFVEYFNFTENKQKQKKILKKAKKSFIFYFSIKSKFIFFEIVLAKVIQSI
jgi:hypothetical protein